VKSLSSAMNAKIVGSGKDSIILAHGYGGDHTVWDKIVPTLSQHYRGIVFDWVCAGAVKDFNLFDYEKHSSYDGFADDLIGLMDEMKLKGVTFMGHSMSGMFGCIASVKRPDLFQRLVLLGASPRYINLDDYEGGFDEPAIANIITSIESNFQNWATGFTPLVVGSHNEPNHLRKFESSLKSMRPEIALAMAKTVFYSDHRQVLDKVTKPCTIIQTTSDVAVPNSVGFYMMDRIKGKSTVEIVDNDGHLPQLTADKELIGVLSGVLGFGIVDESKKTEDQQDSLLVA
jgi:pimeloyl-ACP methyl ester carboxylesterase